MSYRMTRFSGHILFVLLLAYFSTGNALAQIHHSGATPGQFAVQSSGASTYTVPLSVPPGISGMQPELNLIYSSQAGNGPFGIGWFLSGLSAISRCPATVAQDGFIDPVDFDNNDRFCLDGQRLVPIATGASEYRTEIDSFAKITSSGPTDNPDQFVVKTKDGKTLVYGLNDARIEANGINAGKVRLWALKSNTDVSGNAVVYNYIQNVAAGSYRLDNIEYMFTRDGVPHARVDLIYESRTDNRVPRFIVGSTATVQERVSAIETTVSDSVVRRYQFAYENSGLSGLSRLINVSECSADNICKPASQFEFGAESDRFANERWFTGSQNITYSVFGYPETFSGSDWIEQGDYNGDGRTDYAQVIFYPVFFVGILVKVRVFLSNGTGFDRQEWISQYSGPPIGTNQYKSHSISGDFNADGLSDIALVYDNGSGVSQIHMLTSTGSSFTGSLWMANAGTFTPQDNWQVGDFDGDGRNDLFQVRGDPPGRILVRAFVSSGADFSIKTTYQINAPYDSRYPWLVADFNGDGRSDVARLTGDPYRTVISVFKSDGTNFVPETWISGQGQFSWAYIWRVGDFNGDGNADIAKITYGCHLRCISEMTNVNVDIYTSTGRGFSLGGRWTSTELVFSSGSWVVGDFNSDGADDILAIYNDGSGGTADLFAFTNGSFTVRNWAQQVGGNIYTWNLWLVGNFTGEGPEVARLFIESQYLTANVLTNRQGPVNRITRIEDGLGEWHEITYGTLTDLAIYSKTASAQYPHLSIQSPMLVTASHSRSDGLGGAYVHNYSYANAVVDLEGRGFLGFGSYTVSDPQTGVTETYTLNQQFPTTGLVESTESRQADGSILSRSTTSWTVPAQRFSGVYVVQATGTEEWTCDPALPCDDASDMSNAISHTTTAKTYNSYNDVLTMVVDYNDGHRKTTISSYAPEDETNWILGRLLATEVTHEAPAQLPIVRRSAFSYYPNGRLKTEVVEPGKADFELTTTYEYDAYGNTYRKTVSGNPAAAPDYRIATISSTTTIDYTGLGDALDPRVVTTTTNALGHSEVKIIDARLGVIKTLTGPNGRTTTWQYDLLGRKIKEIRADGTWTRIDYLLCELSAPCTDKLQQSLGSPLAVITTSSSGGRAVVYFDSLGREIMKTSLGFSGQTVHLRTEYDTFGRVSRQSLPDFSPNPVNWAIFSYDLLGRKITETAPNGAVTTIAYSGRGTGTYGLRITTTNDLGQATLKVKDAQGRLVEAVDDALSSTQYQYDPVGKLVKVTDPAGHITTMSYDILGNKTAMNDPDMGVWEYRYNALGQLVWQKDARGQVSTMQYDVLGRMIRRVEPEGVSEWTYDTAVNAIGQLARVTGPEGYQRELFYDSLGRLETSITLAASTTLQQSFTYDIQGRIATTTYPSGVSVKNVYNAWGNLAEIRNAANDDLYWKGVFADASGRFTYEELGNGVQTTHTYDEASGFLKEIATMSPATGTADIQNLSYTFDSLGNLVKREDVNLTRVETFRYDNLNRLVEAQVVGMGARTYQYDTIGNITFKSDVGAYEYGQGAGPHAVTHVAGKDYTYDANGNMISGGGRLLTYTSFNKPLKITKGAASIAYSYAPDRNRIGKTVVKDGLSEYTLYLGKSYEQVYGTGGAVEHRHYLSTGHTTILVSKTGSGASSARYLHKDHIGSTEVITDATGQVVESTSFDPWGARRNADWTSTDNWLTNPLDISSLTTRGFTGHEHDAAIGLINMNARMYDPVLGRFLQPDTYVQFPESAQGYNRYTYVNNNPLSFTDPSGNFLSGLRSTLKKWAKKGRKYVRTVASIMMAAAIPNPFWGGFFAGFISSGGDLNASLLGGIFAMGFSGLHDMQVGWARVGAHGVMGGLQQEFSGGRFKDGFFSAGITQLISWQRGFNRLGSGKAASSRLKNAFAAGFVGGTASVMSGGKFKNGALTGAFSRLFNDLVWTGRKKGEMYNTETGEIVQLRTDNVRQTGEGFAIEMTTPQEDIGSTNLYNSYSQDNAICYAACAVAAELSSSDFEGEGYVAKGLELAAEYPGSVQNRLINILHSYKMVKLLSNTVTYPARLNSCLASECKPYSLIPDPIE